MTAITILTLQRRRLKRHRLTYRRLLVIFGRVFNAKLTVNIQQRAVLIALVM